ncbi:SAM-dependent methyltransferase [Streptomyces sp. NBC_01003]|nr:SAM-dependent methyltransferase [Streptomyces sp. NBC_01003]
MGDDAPRHDSAERPHMRIDGSKAHPARVYDAFLGGTDNSVYATVTLKR